jgi:hypothetical protein
MDWNRKWNKFIRKHYRIEKDTVKPLKIKTNPKDNLKNSSKKKWI